MRKLVRQGRTDPTVIWAAQQLARKVGRKDYTGQARKIFNFVRRHIHYVRDPKGVELLRSPFQTLRYRAGDCDDQAILFSALAEAIGFDTRLKTIKANIAHPDEFSHVYSQVLIPNRGWMSADTIVPKVDLGWEASHHFGSQVWGGESEMKRGGGLFNLTDYHYRAVPSAPVSSSMGALGGRSAKRVLIMTRAAMQAALMPYYWSPINRWMFEVYRRAKDTIDALKAKRKPQYIAGPPPGLAQIDIEAEIKVAVISEIPGSSLVTAIDNIFKSSAAKTAGSKTQFYLNSFKNELMPLISKDLGKLLKEFSRAGGMVPRPPYDKSGKPLENPELASTKYMDDWYKMTYTVPGCYLGGMGATQPHRSWVYVALEHFHRNCAGKIKPMKEAADILGVAYKANVAVAGDAAEKAGEKVAEAAVQQEVIAPEEAHQAMQIAKKIAQGYALTPEEHILAEKMGMGIRRAEVASAGKLLVPAVAVAAAAKVFLL